MQQLPPPPPAGAAPSSTAPQSLVSRARTAIHSAATRVLTDIKADLRDVEGFGGRSRTPSPRVSLDREPDAVVASDVKLPSPRDEVLEVNPSGNEDCSNALSESTSSTKLTFPPASTVKQLVAAIENGKSFKSMNDMRSTGDQMLKEKGGLSLSVVKSLVRREKEERSSSEFFGDEETQSLMYSLFKLEEQFPPDGSQCNPEYSTTLSKDLHGAPPGSFIHHLAQLRKLWSDWQPVPRMPLDSAPDLNCCLLHQEIQVINCCVARKKRREAAKESMDSLLKRASIDNSNPRFSNGESPDNGMYARDCTGKVLFYFFLSSYFIIIILSFVISKLFTICTQEGPIMTAELIKETEELVLRTGRESIFDALEVIEPSKLFEQLLAVILSVCFVAAESVVPVDNNLSKLFYECKDYIIGVYQDDMSKEKLDEICKVYETMEAIVTHPEEALQIMDQPDEKSVENKNRFKLKLSFMSKDRPPLWKRGVKDEKKTPPKDERNSSEEKNTKIFSNLLDRKVSIFSKKNAKSPEAPQALPSSDLGQLDESEWTIL
ncbi:hypothetical protein PR202_ga29857 [Eleusine coracana subsp. coracana]|uniref:Rab3 GTPase-activating protein catalytic subunit n=1 Tax=Eleusine coracana subsp. coracana TaxID=191504 RepID=A0AAV5DL24_ELECO|nr:hypothetical protein PR202_ga29857 [Eleusine coracana subsp. coracana]